LSALGGLTKIQKTNKTRSIFLAASTGYDSFFFFGKVYHIFKKEKVIKGFAQTGKIPNIPVP
jgi:hypothetical protein